jgi:CubicO group peptidase (beta-lactamase class C family)
MRSTDLLRGFDGRIDELRIWDRALTVAEIQTSMNLELLGTEPGLIAYYRLNSAQGQVALDSSTLSNNATLGSTTAVDLNDPTWISIVNQAPVVDAGPNQIVVLSNNTANLNGSFSDDGLSGAAVLTSWSVVSGPGMVVFTDAANVNTTATFSDAGLYQLRLQADDGNLVGFDDVMVTVEPTAVLTSITVQSSSTKVDVGTTMLFTATGYDQAGNPITITPVWSTSGGSIDAQGNYTAPMLTGAYIITASYSNISGTKGVSVIYSGAYIWPTNGWTIVLPSEAGLQQTLLAQARDYALTGNGSGSIIKNGQQVFSWGDLTTLYGLKSTSKSFGAALAGLALKDGLVNLDELAQLYLPDMGIPPQTNSDTGWLGQVTLKHLLTHTAGFASGGGYIDLLFQPGMVWSYSNGGTNWLADVLTVTFNQDLKTVLFDSLLTPMGLSTVDLSWRNNSYRTDTINGIKRREFGSGIRANMDAMTRFGYLFLRQGEWDGQQLLPDYYINELRTAAPSLMGLPVNLPAKYFSATDHYGYLWWNNADGTMPNVPKDAYWAWGLNDSLIVVIPSLEIVAARAGDGWRTGWDGDYSVIEPFLEPIVLATLGEKYNITAGTTGAVLDVLSNDMNIGFDGETLTIINVGLTSNGGVVTNLSTTLTYTPPAGFIGTEIFDYTVQSSSGTTFTVTVTINVQAILADGDLTGDGVVDVRDLLRGYRIVIGLVTPDAAEIQRGDVAPLVNGQPASDGVITLGDIIVIQRKVLGNITF